MSSIQCPFCGAAMNLPLKFCVSCGRSLAHIHPHTIHKTGSGSSGATRESDISSPETSFRLGKKSYVWHRQIRHFCLTSSTILALLLVYYITMRCILNEHLPGNIDQWLEKLFAHQQTTTLTNIKTRPNLSDEQNALSP